MAASSVRPGFSTVSPYLVIRDPDAALAFYRRALGAVELSRQVDAQGRIRHAEMKIGDSTFMLTGESPKFSFMRSVQAMGGSPVQFFVYVDGVDERFRCALDAGGKELMSLADQPYGRGGGFTDPFGIIWWLSTHPTQPGPK